MGAPSDIDRLIELGLNRYGAGDLDGALLMWEEALAIEPDNERALGYVEYVRHNYELLSRGNFELSYADDAPFGIEEEPEYYIEISGGELVHSQPMYADKPVDAGWFDDVPTHDRLHPDDDAPQELEIEAELPPPPEVNFEDATREYYGAPTNPAPPSGPLPQLELETSSDADFSETAGTAEFQHGFHPEGTPVGFSTQETEIRKRDLGFVQPTSPAPVPVTDKPSSPIAMGGAPTLDHIALGELTQNRSPPEPTSPGEKTFERGAFAPTADEADERDLLEGLPVPGRTSGPPSVSLDAETQDIPLISSSKAITKELPDGGRLPSSKAVTKELPDSRRLPARRDSEGPPARRDSEGLSQAEVMLSHTPTKDFTPPKIDIGAPTRELGLRPPGKRPGTLSNPVDEDAPTKQSDVRAIRETLRDQGRADSMSETTNADIRVPLDPMEARAAQILDEIDAEAPANEPHDEQTRRRINSLLERAVAWNQAGDTERAVSAVDLAIAEDPNSALGQKLITRNRDTIMQVFQGYLGNLDRQPQLAMPLHELQNAPISPRAAFLLSRIDGTLTIDELLDVSGMPRLEAYRHLCQLYLRGILR